MNILNELDFWKNYLITSYLNDCSSILIVIAIISSVYFAKKLLQWRRIKKKIAKKCNDTDSRKIGLFQKFQGMKKPFENIKVICELTGSEIQSKIRSHDFLAVDVLEAFQANSLMKNNDLNFLADVIYEADVSSLMVDPKNNSGVMALPLSVSDGLCIEKYDSTFGLLKESFHPNKKDCVVVKVLRENGAIPSIITCTGQGDIMMGTGNLFSGKTIHPGNSKLSCGGNSGSAAVALATNSSIIGIATDLQGEIRVPASFCGVYGLKPTSKRISKRFTKSLGHKQNIIDYSIGPLARNVSDLISLFRSISTERMFELDPFCPPVAFNEALFSSEKPLTIGYYVNIGSNQSECTPAVERAVLEAKKALENVGHKLVKYQLPNVEKVFNKVHSTIMASDAGQSIINDVIKGESIDSSLNWYVRLLKLPNLVKRLLGSFVSLFCKPGGDWIKSLAGASVYNMWKNKDVIDSYKEEVLASWEHNNLDAVICPVAPTASVDLKGSHCVINENIYSIIYNILDFPAGSLPVTNVNQLDLDKLVKCQSKKTCCQRKCDMENKSVGLPVGVQCVTLPWREEIVLRIMQNISDKI